MILVRTVFQAKWGKAQELVAAFKEGMRGAERQPRILTDLSGPFHTVVLEGEHESLAAWERFRAQMFADPQFAAGSRRVDELVESGRTEYYTIESD